ncbi:helix-turn-helix domain-containing protein [Streptomyces sp. WAC02707]|uniref:helix-turn-helix domain-containing protein n=1 Tax=Streptomyces sp. WAC02707 TaxID=2487417 RepID=UPI0021AE6653|nr:helix-turn-helix domain-containing protein [Streptomyces sp. WAC02707]
MALAAPGEPHRLADLARRTGFTKPTVHRLLRSLSAAGFAEPAAGGSYRPGPRLLGLAAAVLGEDPLLRHVRAVLDELLARTGLSASFAVRDREWLVHFEVLSHRTGLALGPVPATGNASRSGAGGLLVRALSGPSSDERLASVRETDAAAERLARAARDGWALDPADPASARRTLAVAVRATDGSLAGVLVLSGPVFASTTRQPTCTHRSCSLPHAASRPGWRRRRRLGSASLWKQTARSTRPGSGFAEPWARRHPVRVVRR